MRHSQAQNVVERIFGVAKKHFSILQETNEYPMPTQAKIVSACGVMHNFIRTYDPDEVLEPGEPEAVTLPLQMPGGLWYWQHWWAREPQSFKAEGGHCQSHVAGLPAGVGEERAGLACI